MGLQWQAEGHSHGGGAAEGRIAELDAKIRNWPRHAENDPYKVGLEQLAAELKALLPNQLSAVGYNEFCRPSIPEAVEQVIRQGAQRVLVVPSMLTPGGVHSEVDIPKALEALRRKYPEVSIEYLWPFDVKEVAGLLASQVKAKGAFLDVPRPTGQERLPR